MVSDLRDRQHSPGGDQAVALPSSPCHMPPDDSMPLDDAGVRARRAISRRYSWNPSCVSARARHVVGIGDPRVILGTPAHRAVALELTEVA
jgi:hypothetical protein